MPTLRGGLQATCGQGSYAYFKIALHKNGEGMVAASDSGFGRAERTSDVALVLPHGFNRLDKLFEAPSKNGPVNSVACRNRNTNG